MDSVARGWVKGGCREGGRQTIMTFLEKLWHQKVAYTTLLGSLGQEISSNCTLITQLLPSFVTITSVIIYRVGKILTRSESRSVKCLHFTETLGIDSLELSILLLNKWGAIPSWGRVVATSEYFGSVYHSLGVKKFSLEARYDEN